MIELVKQQPHALRLASAALQDDCGMVLEAAKQDGRALLYKRLCSTKDTQHVIRLSSGKLELGEG
jgi:hypothetical protein